MASVIQIGNKFRAQVRRTGQPTLTKTFPNKETPCKTLEDAEKAANKWAALQENDIDAGKQVGIHGRTGMTVGETIDRYLSEKKDIAFTYVYALRSIKAAIGKRFLSKLTSQEVVDYIKNKGCGPATAAFHFACLSSVLSMAKIGWEYHVPEILQKARDRLTFLKLIGKSEERDRRPTPAEIKLLLEFDYGGKLPMPDIISFAIASAMRQAEITRIKHETFDDGHKTVVITDRKHPKKKKGNHKIVPLLDEAIEIINRQPKVEGNDNIFPFPAAYISEVFTETCKTIGISNLHFHDLRHEGTSRLFEMGYQIHEVAMFTGHEDWKSLKRYTQLKAKDIRRLEAPKIEPLKPEPAKIDNSKIQPHAVEIDMADFEEFKQFQRMKKMMETMKQTEVA